MSAADRSGRARVLVCDDETQILRALRVILRDAGFEAMPASTGEEALDLAAVSHPEAAIVDLRRTEPDEQPPVIATGELAIDLAARRVTLAGEAVHLTPIEFALLAQLARNRGRLLTHRDLLMAVWGPGYDHDTQVLRAHIANLRRKIEPAGRTGGPLYIHTDPGVGYRFAA